jgi:hypothetical protein
MKYWVATRVMLYSNLDRQRIQQWCNQQFTHIGWATGLHIDAMCPEDKQPDESHITLRWYFWKESDATLFMLAWSDFVV